MEWLKKVTDFIMPIEVEEEEEAVEERSHVAEKAESQQGASFVSQPAMESQGTGFASQVMERKVVGGGTVSYGGMSYTVTENPEPSRPAPKARAAKAQELMIKLYTPTTFDQVTDVADDIKGKRAVVINYEKVDLSEQRRICDFVNGVCYVTNGDARRISSSIVLYVPDGVDAEDAMANVALG